jgi:hypothetical protein
MMRHFPKIEEKQKMAAYQILISHHNSLKQVKLIFSDQNDRKRFDIVLHCFLFL